MSTQILRIALPSPLRRLFDYLPLKDQPLPEVGMRVSVPFGHQKSVMGVVVEVIESLEGSSRGYRLKSIHTVLDEQPVFDQALLALCRWCSAYYHYPLGEVFQLALPVVLRKPETAPTIAQVKAWQLTPIGHSLDIGDIKRAVKQRNAIILLKEKPLCLREDFQTIGVSSSVIKALVEKGWVEETVQSSTSASDWSMYSSLLKQSPLSLNAEQEQAVSSLDLSTFAAYLLEGVTGSGKTEVYLQLIERVLANKRQALVLVPEIGLTPQTVERFEQRFSVPVAAVHSGLNDKERYEIWVKARENYFGIVIGTRSSLFTPLNQLGLIIVDEEHDLSYKQQEGVRYSARDVAIVYAQQCGIPIVLGSATPSLESLHNALSGRYRHLRLQQRVNHQPLPVIETVDSGDAHEGHPLSPVLMNAIEQTLQARQQVLVFINRRGYAPLLMCQDCGWSSQCQQCDRRMTLHRTREGSYLHCHYCDAKASVPAACPQCLSRRFQAIGLGTQQGEAVFKKRFSEVPVVRIDRDSISRKGEWETVLTNIHLGEPCILVGTQMLAKGHHFPKLGLAIMLGVDQALFSADFRGAERIAQLLTQVSGRVGREGAGAKVLIQTQFAEHPLLDALITQGYHDYAQQLLAERRLAAMPPLTYIALVRCHAQQAEFAIRFLEQARQIAERLLPATEELHYLGPFPSSLEKRNNRYHYYLQIKTDQRQMRQQLLDKLCVELEKLKQPRGLVWLVDVDPMDF